MSSISQQGGDSETARAIARPPFLFLVALLLGFVSDHLLPLPFPISRIGLAHWISAGVAGSLIFIGIGVFAAGIRNFSSAATPVQGTRPTRALVRPEFTVGAAIPSISACFSFTVASA